MSPQGGRPSSPRPTTKRQWQADQRERTLSPGPVAVPVIFPAGTANRLRLWREGFVYNLIAITWIDARQALILITVVGVTGPEVLALKR